MSCRKNLRGLVPQERKRQSTLGEGRAGRKELRITIRGMCANKRGLIRKDKKKFWEKKPSRSNSRGKLAERLKKHLEAHGAEYLEKRSLQL